MKVYSIYCMLPVYLKEQIRQKYLKFSEANSKASEEKCKKLLEELEENLMTNLKEGKYTKSGGFADYQEEVQMITALYESIPDLGVQVRASNFLSLL